MYLPDKDVIKFKESYNKIL